MKKYGWPVEFIKIKGDSPLEKFFWASSFGDWLSYHLALYYGVDPTTIEIINEYKKLLNQ
jgi:hypothetical protein